MSVPIGHTGGTATGTREVVLRLCWQKRRFFPDFILTIRDSAGESFIEVNLLEPTGGHIAHTQGKSYKRQLSEVYERTEVKAPWKRQETMFTNKVKRVSVVFLDEGHRQSKLNEVLH